ncbi:MAG: ThuA domain-containing protein [Verrucomicrobiota bacterium]
MTSTIRFQYGSFARLFLTAVWFATQGHLSAQPANLPEAERQRVEAAIPSRAVVAPRKARRLLIFDRNVNYGGHRSIPTANLACTLMGRKTGAFETEISSDPGVFRPENLRRFDAVFFNNNVGNLFDDPALRQSVADFIYGGGGMLGVHGTTVAFTKWPGAVEDWPEFGRMIGARGANHKASDERVVIKLDDPDHPLNRVFNGAGFEYRDEFFRVQEPYSRNRLRVLFSIDTGKTDMNQQPSYGSLVRPDDDYALAWVRNYGRGRTFYCTIAHNPSVFWDPQMLQFIWGPFSSLWVTSPLRLARAVDPCPARPREARVAFGHRSLRSTNTPSSKRSKRRPSLDCHTWEA